jgi:hypothetical protein
LYTDPTDPALHAWIEKDLNGTDATWKFAVCHHPPFNAGGVHYQHEHMRVLTPLLEKCGIDIWFTGHEHVYQRSMPFRFLPSDVSKAKQVHLADRRTPGAFTIHHEFDGNKVTKAHGIVHITTGAGGKRLYDPGYDNAPEKWLHEDDNNVAYVAKFHSVKHSFTVIDIDGDHLSLAQIDEEGNEFDRIRMTKA